MKRDRVLQAILTLDGGNASSIGKRVGRSAATIERWKREGMPASVREAVKAALDRHNRAVKAAATRKRVPAPSKVKPTPTRTTKAQRRHEAVLKAIATRQAKREEKERLAELERRAERRREAAQRGAATRRANAAAKAEAVRLAHVKAEETKRRFKAAKERAKAREAEEDEFQRATRLQFEKEFREEFERELRAKKLSAEFLGPTGPTVVPLTEAEFKQGPQQLAIILEMKRWIDNKVSLETFRANPSKETGVNGIAPLHGKNAEDRSVLRDLIANEDKYWLAMTAKAAALGLSIDDARNSWFSPKI